ncbi:dicarboxylic acid hydrolase [Bordetella ansorpii]|uniref:Dicarboxylic acid hydrolase n=1 Tax=Bordetella ansorpii TaxID=288768 RepID=A0A157SB37_9BORD|nr:amidohydrolase family protein [Bordetella ansorpii]SAI67443.1 dicarboxylic acid hydrolase [Bordetella ansorpii]
MSRTCLPPHDTVQPVRFDIPAHACDSHAHIFGPFDRYPLAAERSYTPPENPCEAFLAHLSSIGFERGVIVTASAYGTDNQSMLDALKAHPDRLRGVAVADAATEAGTLRAWRNAGVCGLRFNLYAVGGAKVYRNGVGLEALEALAPAMRDLDMHAQIWIHAPDLADLAPRLEKLDVPLVVDHMGRMNATLGTADPGFQQLCRMLAGGRAWTKISGADRNTNQRGDYADIDPYVRALVAANPERIVWGTDWPHINYFEAGDVPDDGRLLNTLHRWLPDPALRHRILVDNPARIYRF